MDEKPPLGMGRSSARFPRVDGVQKLLLSQVNVFHSELIEHIYICVCVFSVAVMDVYFLGGIPVFHGKFGAWSGAIWLRFTPPDW